MWEKFRRPVANVAAVGVLAVGGFTVVSPAFAGGDGPANNNCFGRYYNTSWDQRCGGGGASQSGYYQSEAVCTGIDSNSTLERYRGRGTGVVYRGPDCRYGITNVYTRFRSQ